MSPIGFDRDYIDNLTQNLLSQRQVGVKNIIRLNLLFFLYTLD